MNEFDKLDQFLRDNKPGIPKAPQDHEARMLARWSKTKPRNTKIQWAWLAAAILLLGIWGLWSRQSEDVAIEPILLSMVETFESPDNYWDEDIYEDWLSLGRLLSSSQ